MSTGRRAAAGQKRTAVLWGVFLVVLALCSAMAQSRNVRRPASDASSAREVSRSGERAGISEVEAEAESASKRFLDDASVRRRGGGGGRRGSSSSGGSRVTKSVKKSAKKSVFKKKKSKKKKKKAPIIVTDPDLPGTTSEEDDEDDDGANCFPGSAEVSLEDGSTRTMAQLEVGDRVLCGDGRYSPVYMFTHRLPDARATFHRVTTTCGRTLLLTGGHYLQLDGRLQAARGARAGADAVRGDGVRARVARVERGVAARGLFNPVTACGDVVVGGLVASVYTTAVEPRVAHALLGPLRAAYAWAGRDVTCGWLEGGAPEGWVGSALPVGGPVV